MPLPSPLLPSEVRHDARTLKRLLLRQSVVVFSVQAAVVEARSWLSTTDTPASESESGACASAAAIALTSSDAALAACSICHCSAPAETLGAKHVLNAFVSWTGWKAVFCGLVYVRLTPVSVSVTVITVATFVSPPAKTQKRWDSPQASSTLTTTSTFFGSKKVK